MLIELNVQGLGVIESSEVSLSSGSTALTGETGAGKTLLVLALGLLRGGRAERSMVRQGAQRAQVEGRFRVPADSHIAARLRGLDIEVEEEDGEAEIILSRSVAPDGRAGRSRINGSMVSVGELASIGEALIEIAGQNEHGRVASATFQRETLDRYAGASSTASEVRELVRSARRAEVEAAKWRESERERVRELDILRYEIGEIEAANLEVGEIARLMAEAKRLENAESINAALTGAAEDLRGDGGAGDRLGGAESHLRAAAAHDPGLGSLAARLEAARLEIEDVAAEVSAATAPPDADDLAFVQDRLAALARLRRRFGDTEEEVLRHLERSRSRVEDLTRADDRAAELEDASSKAWAEAGKLATELSASRSSAASKLSKAMETKMADLALAGARFIIDLAPSDLGEHGAEEVSFLVSANPGEPPKAIGKIASGGELSRISLALHLLTRDESAGTLIFDEVDAGVGGEAAQWIGRALADLARTRRAQVLVVTHLPQVAAFADHHLRVVKTTVKDSTSAEVRAVEGDERVLELSRMLAGLPGSELGQEHARELLSVASNGTS